jgi:pyruvate,orthophosphate dikinase
MKFVEEESLPYCFQTLWRWVDTLANIAKELHKIARESLVKLRPNFKFEKDQRLIVKIVGDELHEHNPMLGLRGARLALLRPELYEMQVEAIITAAIRAKRKGIDVHPEIEIPMVCDSGELARLKELVERTVAKVEDKERVAPGYVAYTFGSMIELPRAAETAGELALTTQFLGWGTNDLTQTTFGMSRDDIARVFRAYETDPRTASLASVFATLDPKGVAALMRRAIPIARRINPDIVIGICGEHGGDPASIAQCDAMGMDYVSCSTARIPIAWWAAALANINATSEGSGYRLAA